MVMLSTGTSNFVLYGEAVYALLGGLIVLAISGYQYFVTGEVSFNL